MKRPVDQLTPEQKAELIDKIVKSLELPAFFRINRKTYEFICEYIESHGGYEKFQQELERKQKQIETGSIFTSKSNQANSNNVQNIPSVS